MHTPVSFISSPTVDLFAVRHSGGIFFPQSSVWLAVCSTAPCISLTPAGGDGALQANAGIEWEPVGNVKVFPWGAE